MEDNNSENMEDREMHKAKCSDCGAECEVPFKPTPGKDVRCQDCFRKNRPQRSNRGGGFNRGGGGFNRGGGFGGGNFDRRPREMHKTTCAKCKKECEVPFKPTEGRDVFCKDCFENQKQGDFERPKKDNSDESNEEF